MHYMKKKFSIRLPHTVGKLWLSSFQWCMAWNRLIESISSNRHSCGGTYFNTFSITLAEEKSFCQEKRTFWVSFPRSTRLLRAQTCLTSAREDLQAIASAILAASLGSDTLNISFKLETMADFMPREEDFSESVSRGVLVLLEPRTVWHVLEKTTGPLPVPHYEALSAVKLPTLVSGLKPRPSFYQEKRIFPSQFPEVYSSSKCQELSSMC